MTFKEMFLAEHPIDGEQMLEEARIKAAKGSALFDALETHMKQELLTKLREGVMSLHINYGTYEGDTILLPDVLALLEKAGE